MPVPFLVMELYAQKSGATVSFQGTAVVTLPVVTVLGKGGNTAASNPGGNATGAVDGEAAGGSGAGRLAGSGGGAAATACGAGNAADCAACATGL